ncbi:MAG: pilin [Patescibacteria group bacterium]
MKRLLFYSTIIVFLFFASDGIVAQIPSAGTQYVQVTAQTNDPFGLNDATPSSIKNEIPVAVARMIRGVLGIVGIIFIILVIYGGVTWMTSGGNDQRITTAKKILATATVGLVIIATAFSVTYFIIESLEDAQLPQTSGNCPNGQPPSGTPPHC